MDEYTDIIYDELTNTYMGFVTKINALGLFFRKVAESSDRDYVVRQLDKEMAGTFR